MKSKKFRSAMGALLAREPRLGAQPKLGDIVEGTVLEKTGRALYLALPPYGAGIVFGKEYREAKEIIRGLEQGGRVLAKVVEPENDAGYTELSLREAGRERSWSELKALQGAHETVEVVVVGANRGGLIVELDRIQGFLPASQLNSQHYPRVKDGDKHKILAELQKFMGETLPVKIMTVAPKEEKLIVSEKDVELEGLAGILAQYHVGDSVEGEVSGIVDFGVFVRFRPLVPEGMAAESLPELEGLIHISELDYKLVTNPADIVQVGERVTAKIIAIDRGRISLSLKRLKEDPWQHIERRYSRGDLVQGKVIKIDHYGALVELSPGIHGLCHISELGSFEEVVETFRVGESHPFRILELKSDERKLTLGFLRRPTPPEIERVSAEVMPDSSAPHEMSDHSAL